MKSSRVAILTAALGLLTACPQADQFFTPGGYNAGSPPSASQSGSQEKNEEGDAPEETTPPETPSGPPKPGGPQDVASGKPIDPKADDYSVEELIMYFTAVRFRYGPNFETLLDPKVPPDAPEVPKFILPPEGAILFPGFAELTEKGENVTGWTDSKDYEIRMVFRPDANPDKPVYCDAQVLSDFKAEYGGNVTFFGVAAGKGKLSFYHPIQYADLFQQPSLDSDPASSCSMAGWKPLLKEAGLPDEWIYLGSLRAEPLSSPPVYRPYTGPVKAVPSVIILP